jgi:hypothetical protein
METCTVPLPSHEHVHGPVCLSLWQCLRKLDVGVTINDVAWAPNLGRCVRTHVTVLDVHTHTRLFAHTCLRHARGMLTHAAACSHTRLIAVLTRHSCRIASLRASSSRMQPPLAAPPPCDLASLAELLHSVALRCHRSFHQIASASADKAVRVWRVTLEGGACVAGEPELLKDHSAPVSDD